MSKKEERESLKEFNKRPGEMAKLKAIRKSSRESLHGKGVVTRGKNKGLTRGKGKD